MSGDKSKKLIVTVEYTVDGLGITEAGLLKDLLRVGEDSMDLSEDYSLFDYDPIYTVMSVEIG